MSWLTDLRKYYLFRVLIKRFIMPIGVVRMLDVGTTVEQIALIVGISNVVMLLAEVPSGAISDHLGHRRTLIIAMLGEAIAMACFFGNNAWWMGAMLVIFYASGSLLSGTAEALFYEWLEKNDRLEEHARLSGRAKTIANAVSIISMVSAGLLYAWIWWIPFVIAVVQFLLAAVVISRFGPPDEEYEHHVRSEGILYSYKHIPEAVRILRSSTALWWIAITGNVLIAIAITGTEFHQILLQNIGVATAVFGFVYAVKRLIATAGYAISGWVVERLHPVTVIVALFLMNAIHFLLMDSVVNVYSMTAVFALNSFTLAVMSIASNHYQNTLTPSGSRATVLSVGRLFHQIVMVLAAAWVGAAAGWWRLEYGYVSIGLLMAVLGVVFYPVLRKAVSGSVIDTEVQSAS